MAFAAAQGGGESRPCKFFFSKNPRPKHARTPPVPAAPRTLFAASCGGRRGLPRRLGAEPGRAARPDGTVKPRGSLQHATTPEKRNTAPPATLTIESG